MESNFIDMNRKKYQREERILEKIKERDEITRKKNYERYLMKYRTILV